MNFELVELDELSGNKATIYSVILDDDDVTLYDYFIDENIADYEKEVHSINTRLETIGKYTGARSHFFKLNEGVPGDGVCALYDDPDILLRLYCIRYGSCAIILGGGGPKNTGTWQEDDKLRLEAETLIEISEIISKRIVDGGLRWGTDGMQLVGNLIFSKNDE